MFRESLVHNFRLWVNITKENTRTELWFNMNARVTEIGVASFISRLAVHNLSIVVTTVYEQE